MSATVPQHSGEVSYDSFLGDILNVHCALNALYVYGRRNAVDADIINKLETASIAVAHAWCMKRTNRE